MAGISVDGLISGTKTTTIIDGLMAADRGPVKLMEDKRTLTKGRLDILRSLNTKVLSASLDLSDLKRAATFSRLSASASDSTAMSATVGSSAARGTWSFNVTQLAQAHQLASVGQSSRSAPLVTTAGGLDLTVAGTTTSLVVVPGTSSLDDLAKQVNDAKLGVTASVVNSGGATGWRLVMTADKTGASNAISVAGSGDLAGLFGVGSQTLAAALDAKLEFGSALGGGAPLVVTSATNIFTDVVPDVTITAQKIASGVTLTIGADGESAAKAVTTFVDSYNIAIKYFNDNAKYDAAGGKIGALFAESDVRLGLGGIADAFTAAVPGLPLGLNNIGSLGISISRTDGTFTVDKAALSAALAQDPQAVAKLFANSGTSTTTGIAFAAMSTKTSTKNPFAVSITSAATQAQTATTAALDASTQIALGDGPLGLTINGRRVDVDLAVGTYTREALAAHVAERANAQLSGFDRITATVAGDGSLKLQAQAYGSAITMRVEAGTVANKLKLQTGSIATGQNVAGTIDGVAASGTGQILSGAAGTAAEGLSLQVTVGAGTTATVTARKGIAQQVGERMTGLTDSGSGALTQKEDGFEAQIEDLSARIKAGETRLEARRARYYKQFRAMEQTVARLQSNGNALTGFINALNGTANAAKNG